MWCCSSPCFQNFTRPQEERRAQPSANSFSVCLRDPLADPHIVSKLSRANFVNTTGQRQRVGHIYLHTPPAAAKGAESGDRAHHAARLRWLAQRASMPSSGSLSEAAANALVADYHVALWTSVLLIAVLFAVVYFVRFFAFGRARPLSSWNPLTSAPLPPLARCWKWGRRLWTPSYARRCLKNAAAQWAGAAAVRTPSGSSNGFLFFFLLRPPLLTEGPVGRASELILAEEQETQR